jgi:hypothetical protein
MLNKGKRYFYEKKPFNVGNEYSKNPDSFLALVLIFASCKNGIHM